MGQGFRDLVAWQKAMALVTAVYRETRTFPADERFGLTNQLRRAAVSIPSNIAEGHGRPTRGEFIQFQGIARGSVAELETQIEIAGNLGFIENEKCSVLQERASEVARVLNGLIASLRTDN